MQLRTNTSDKRRNNRPRTIRMLFSAVALAGLMTGCAQKEVQTYAQKRAQTTWEFLCRSPRRYYAVPGPELVFRKRSFEAVKAIGLTEETLKKVEKLDNAIIKAKAELKRLTNNDESLSCGSVNSKEEERARILGIKRAEEMVAQRNRLLEDEAVDSFIIPVSEFPPGTSFGMRGYGHGSGIWTGVLLSRKLFCK